MNHECDIPAWTCQVASIEMPSGAAMLANVFAAWRLPIIDPWGLSTAELYTQDGGGRICLPKSLTGFETLMPVLVERRRFAWDRRVVPCFHHRDAGCAPDLCKAIWVVRDPRDCLYSDWRRHGFGTLAFDDYLGAPWRDTGKSPIDHLLAFYRGWLNPPAGLEVLRIRFEDIKRNPVAALHRASGHIGFRPEDAQLEQVPDLVNPDRARSVWRSMPSSLRPSFDPVRAGESQEWQRRWTHEWLDALPADLWDLIERLGYGGAGECESGGRTPLGEHGRR